MANQNTNEGATQGFHRILIGQDVEYLRCYNTLRLWSESIV